MFGLIYISDEKIYDVCRLEVIKFDEKGSYILRSKTKIRINLICSNENEHILTEIKSQNNSKFPELVLEKARVKEIPSCSAKRRLFTLDNDEMYDVAKMSDAGSDPFSTDDSIEDPDFKASSSKYDISSSEEDDTAKNEVNNTKKGRQQKNAKKNCCLFCANLFSKITPHLERRHSNETEVKKFMALSKGNPGRKGIIDTLRKQGNFLHMEKTGSKITVRRTQKDSRNYKVCPNCKGLFSISSIRKHYKRCEPNGLQGNRGLLIMSRKLHLEIHPKACDVLKKEIFPVLREDCIANTIRFDELIIIYANRLCQKYKSEHLQKMIRARLRLVGRFVMEIRKIETDVTDFASVFHPKFFDSTISSINLVAKLDDKSGKYRSPSTAFNLGSILKFVSNVLISECIKRQDLNKKNEVEDYLKLLNTELTTAVNKTVAENQLQFKRQKIVTLPSNDDIKKLYDYLTTQRRLYFQKCKDDFSKFAWLNLAGLILISIQLFNRRRAGELERILIEDFRNREGIKEDDDLYKSLSEESQKATKQYVRFTIRGKLARGVPVLLNRELLECVELLLEKRAEIGVSIENPYVFGVPHKQSNLKHLDAYSLMVDLSSKCGAEKPLSLRGTGLRKHIATHCIQLELKENEVKDLANYLGHAEKIHMEHYRMPIAARDITIMSRLLEKAQGTDALQTQQIQDASLNEETSDEVTPGPSTSQPSTVVNETQLPSSDDDMGNKQVHSTPVKRKVVCRTSWITPERQAIHSAFLTHIKSQTLPSLIECQKAKNRFPVLQRRNLAVIKAHVYNEINRRKRSH